MMSSRRKQTDRAENRLHVNGGKQMKVGILGAGGIAEKMAATIAGMKDTENYAIASRDRGKAEAFANRFGFTKACVYEEMLADPAVDLVYIAVPHSLHHRWTIAALQAGKNVLCEKSFAANAAQAQEMIDLAESRRLLLAEAIWTRYMPSRRILADLVNEGTIGKVTTVSANLGYHIEMNDRMTNPALAGGALLDLTVYTLNFASMVHGDDIRKINASCVYTASGVDGQDSVTLEYADGAMASLFTTMYTLTNRMGLLCGEKGFIEVENINNPSQIRVYEPDRDHPKLRASYDVPPQISGYEYEVMACRKALEEGKTECPEMPHAETMAIMRQLDAVRAQYGIVFPFEK